MKIAYFDCFSGASGDMILGALIDAGLSVDDLTRELDKLSLDGFSLQVEKTSKQSISGTKLTVKTEETRAHRHLPEIVKIIDSSSLAPSVKKTALEIFNNLAKSEAKIHNTTVDRIHFHEVGAIDAIVDITGAAIGLHLLEIDEVVTSRIHVGTGFVDCQHGRMPVPAPATLDLLRSVPVYSTGIESELITPTGAAILKTVSSRFGDAPDMTIDSTGYGAGSRELAIPNLLRVWIGKAECQGYEKDEVVIIETNIDNMNPELLAGAVEKMQVDGVLDITLTPIMMKKNRPATKLSVMVRQDSSERLASLIFSEIPTLGLRIQKCSRMKLLRELIKVQTPFGEIEVKLGKRGDELISINPEFESCNRVAIDSGTPVRTVFDAAKAAAKQKLDQSH